MNAPRLVGSSIAGAAGVIALARALTASPPPDLAVADPVARGAMFFAIASDETKMRRDAAKKFPTDFWSQDDDFHQSELKRAKSVAAEHGVRLGDALSAVDEGSRLNGHVLPLLGALDVRTFDREAVERVVEDLDRKISLDEEDDEEHLSWNTASNVWVLLSKMCKEMSNAKRKDLRVREDNPAALVRPPERGEKKAKQYLYPSEFRRLVECKEIDAAYRALYAFAVYTYARSNEIAALTWEDIDLEHWTIHITKSIDRATHKAKPTKTGITRRIPIELALRPLLAMLHSAHEKAKGKKSAPVVWMPDHEDRAILLREHLETAEVKRSELLTSNAHRHRLTFHDLRATGITWAAVRGDNPMQIKQRAGHKGFATTEVYIREAENLRQGFGEPFPPLPSELRVSSSVSAFRHRVPHGAAKFAWYGVEQRGIELYRATNANRAMSLLFSSKCSTFLSSPDFHFVHVSRRGSPSGNPGSGRSWHVPRADRWR